MFYVKKKTLVAKLLHLKDNEFAVWDTDDEQQMEQWEQDFCNYHKVQNSVNVSAQRVTATVNADGEEEVGIEYEHENDSLEGVESLDRFHSDSIANDGIDFEAGVMHGFGEIKVLSKNKDDKCSEFQYYADKYCTMKCKSKRDYVHFKKIKPQGILIPQVKEMNCTLKPEMATRNKVVVGKTEDLEDDLGQLYYNYKEAETKALKAMYALDIAKQSKISFDKWVLIGSVNAIIYRMYRNFKVKGLTIRERVPHCLYITYADLFRNLFPDVTDFKHVTKKVFDEFVDWCMDTFEFFNTHSMLQELPYGKGLGFRKKRKYNSILKTSFVQEYDVYHDKWEQSGIRIYMPDYEMFDRIMPKRRYIPILDYQLDTRKCIAQRFVFETRMLNIYVKWFVMYVNYNITHENRMVKERKKRFITKKDIKNAFKTGKFEEMQTKMSDIDNIFKSMSVDFLGKYDETDRKKNKGIRPANVLEYTVHGTSRVDWVQPTSLKNEDVVARDENGNKRRIDETFLSNKDVAEAKSKMEVINRENNRHRVRLGDNRVETHLQVIFKAVGKLDPLTQNLYQVIQENECGRQYTMLNGFQSLKSKERLDITIDGEQVCEVDYSSLHPRMLYAMEGINYTGDVYDTGNLYQKLGISKEECRLATKLMLLVAINSEHIHNGIYSFKEAWILHEADILERQGKIAQAKAHRQLMKKRGAYKIGWIWQLYYYLEAKHSAIKKYFGTGMGIQLQYIDGKIMRNICYEFASKGHCSLPVHDSLVVKRKDEWMAVELMKKYYEKMFPGFTCPVKIKGSTCGVK